MPQTLLIAIVAGVAGAVLYAAIIALGPVLGVLPWALSPVPLIGAGLVLGPGATVLAALAGAVAFAGATGSLGAAGVYLVSDALPALLIVALASRPAPGRTPADLAAAPNDATRWMPPGELLARLSLLPPLVLIVLALLAPAHPDGLSGLVADWIRDALESMMAGMATVGGQGAPALILDTATRDALVEAAVRFLPGASAGAWVMRAALAGVMAQSLARRAGRARRPTPSWRALMLPDWYAVVFGLSVLAGLGLGGDVGYVAWSVAVGLSLPFMLLGFKLVHEVAGRTPQPTLVLVIFYIVFLSVSALAVLAMIVAGLVEFAAHRRKGANGPASEEE